MKQMKIILNEKEYAENCLREHTLGDNPWASAQILSKYYYDVLGYRQARIIKALTGFISESYPRYANDKARWEENIDFLAKSAGKYPLYQDTAIPVTQKELDTILNCGLSRQHQQVLFSYLCLAKLANQRNNRANGWVNYKTKDVFALAHVSLSTMKQDIMINDFYVRNLVELPKKNDNLAVRVAFCDEPDVKAVMYVSDFRDLGYLYLMQVGENIVACAECGMLMRGNKTGTKKYCSHCAGYVPQEFKIITCVDCGKEFRISAKNTKTCRCQDCQTIKDRERKRLWKANQVDAAIKS